MMGLQRRGPSIVAVKSNTAVPVKETVFIATAMPSCRNRRAGVWKHLFVCIEIRTWKSRPMLQGVSKLHCIRLDTHLNNICEGQLQFKNNYLSITHDATLIARSIERLASNASLTCDVGWWEKNTPACYLIICWWDLQYISNSESLVKMLWFLSSALIHRQLTSIVMVPVVR